MKAVLTKRVYGYGQEHVEKGKTRWNIEEIIIENKYITTKNGRGNSMLKTPLIYYWNLQYLNNIDIRFSYLMHRLIRFSYLMHRLI